MRFTRRHGRATAVFAIAVVALGAAGVAIAETMRGPRTDRVLATFTQNLERRVTKNCAGEDGVYGELVSATFTGQSAGDPRLTGEITSHVRALFRANPKPGVPPDPNLGTAEAHFTIKQGDRVVAEGQQYGTIEGTQLRIEGFVVGRAKAVERDGAIFEGGQLRGGFRTVVDPSGTRATGTFGGVDPEPTDPMVIQHGSCPGPAESNP